MTYTHRIEALAETLAEAVEMSRHAETDANTDRIDFTKVLHTLYALAETVKDAERMTVALARETGASWSDVARAYGGISKQGAQQRWS